MTIHHPSCPARVLAEPTIPRWCTCRTGTLHHLSTACVCICGPEAAAEDAVILAERTPDTMLLDVVAHADQAMGDWLASRVQGAPVTRLGESGPAHGLCGPWQAFEAAEDDEVIACDVCHRPDILDGDDPGCVHDDAHPHGVWVCSEACTVAAIRVMEQESPGGP